MSLLSGVQTVSQRIYTGLQSAYAVTVRSPTSQSIAQQKPDPSPILPVDLILKDPCQCGGQGPCRALLLAIENAEKYMREEKPELATKYLQFISERTAENAQRDGSKLTSEDLKTIQNVFKKIEDIHKLDLANLIARIDSTVEAVEAKANLVIPTSQPEQPTASLLSRLQSELPAAPSLSGSLVSETASAPIQIMPTGNETVPQKGPADSPLDVTELSTNSNPKTIRSPKSDAGPKDTQPKQGPISNETQSNNILTKGHSLSSGRSWSNETSRPGGTPLQDVTPKGTKPEPGPSTRSFQSSENPAKAPSAPPAQFTTTAAPISDATPKGAKPEPGPSTRSFQSSENPAKTPSAPPAQSTATAAPISDATPKSAKPEPGPSTRSFQSSENPAKAPSAPPAQSTATAAPNPGTTPTSQSTSAHHTSAAVVTSNIETPCPETSATAVQQEVSSSPTAVKETILQALPLVRNTISTVLRESHQSPLPELNPLIPQLSESAQHVASLPKFIQAPVIEILSIFSARQPAQIRNQLVATVARTLQTLGQLAPRTVTDTVQTLTAIGKAAPDTLPMLLTAISTVFRENQTATPQILAQQLPIIADLTSSIAIQPKPIQESVIPIFVQIAANSPEHLTQKVVQPILKSIGQIARSEPQRLAIVIRTIAETIQITPRSELPQTIVKITSEIADTAKPQHILQNQTTHLNHAEHTTSSPFTDIPSSSSQPMDIHSNQTLGTDQQITSVLGKLPLKASTEARSPSSIAPSDAEPKIRRPSTIAEAIANWIPDKTSGKQQVVKSLTQALSQISQSSPQLVTLATQSLRTIVQSIPQTETHMIAQQFDQVIPQLVQTATIISTNPQLEPVLIQMIETSVRTTPQSIVSIARKIVDQAPQLHQEIKVLPKSLQTIVLTEISTVAKSAPNLIDPRFVRTLASVAKSYPQLVPAFTQIAIAASKSPLIPGQLPTQIQSLPRILSPLSNLPTETRIAATSILATLGQSSPDWLQPESISIVIQSLNPTISIAPETLPIITTAISTLAKSTPAPTLMARIPSQIAQISATILSIRSLPQPVQREIITVMSAMATSHPALLEPALAHAICQPILESGKISPSLRQAVTIILATAAKTVSGPEVSQLAQSLTQVLRAFNPENTTSESSPPQRSAIATAAKQTLQILSNLSALPTHIGTPITESLTRLAATQPETLASTIRQVATHLIAMATAHPETGSQPSAPPTSMSHSTTPSESAEPRPTPQIQQLAQAIVSHSGGPKSFSPIITLVMTANAAQSEESQIPASQVAQLMRGVMSEVAHLRQPVTETIRHILISLASTQHDSVTPQLIRDIAPPITQIRQVLPQALPVVHDAIQHMTQNPKTIASTLNQISEVIVQISRQNPSTQKPLITLLRAVAQTTPNAITPQIMSPISPTIAAAATAMPEMLPTLTSAIQTMMKSPVHEIGERIHDSIPQIVKSLVQIRELPKIIQSPVLRATTALATIAPEAINPSNIREISTAITHIATLPTATQRVIVATLPHLVTRNPNTLATELPRAFSQLANAVSHLSNAQTIVQTTIPSVISTVIQAAPQQIQPRTIQSLVATFTEIATKTPQLIPIISNALITLIQQQPRLATSSPSSIIQRVSNALSPLTSAPPTIQKSAIIILEDISKTAPTNIKPELTQQLVRVLTILAKTSLQPLDSVTKTLATTATRTPAALPTILTAIRTISTASAQRFPSVISLLEQTPEPHVQPLIRTLTQVTKAAPDTLGAVVRLLTTNVESSTDTLPHILPVLSTITNQAPQSLAPVITLFEHIPPAQATSLSQTLSAVTKTAPQILESITRLIATTIKTAHPSMPALISTLATVAIKVPHMLPAVVTLLVQSPPTQQRPILQLIAIAAKTAPQTLEPLCQLAASMAKSSPKSIPVVLNTLANVASKTPAALQAAITAFQHASPEIHLQLSQLLTSSDHTVGTLTAFATLAAKVTQLPPDISKSVLIRLNSLLKQAPDMVRQLTSIITQLSRYQPNLLNSTIATILSKFDLSLESTPQLQLMLSDLSKLLRQNPEAIERYLLKTTPRHSPFSDQFVQLYETTRQSAAVRSVDPNTLVNLAESATSEWTDEIEKRKKKKIAVRTSEPAGIDALIRHFDAIEQEHWKTAAEFRKMLIERSSVD